MPDFPEGSERALRYLDIIRNEFRQRVELKQQVLTAYILGLSAIAAFVIQGYESHPQYLKILWLIPLVSLASAAFFADHMLVTTTLSRYIRDELEPVLFTPPLKIEFWDRADESKRLVGTFGLLAATQTAIVCLPIVAVLIVEWTYRVHADAIHVLLSCYTVICLAICIRLMELIRKESAEVFGPGGRRPQSKKTLTPQGAAGPANQTTGGTIGEP